MNIKTKKQNLGQFFTTNSSYILQGLGDFIKNKDVSDPFAGNQDLLNWAKNNKCKKFVGFDCDKNYVDNKNVFFNDSINLPKNYKFVCTNPPYLHKNKASAKIKEEFFSGNNSSFEDLYQVSIDTKNNKKIQIEDIRKYKIKGLVGKNTSRNMAHLIFKKEVSIDEQVELMEKFNNELSTNREKYFSFFLTNFRDNNRKRMSFDLAYKFLNLIYYEKNSKQLALF